MTEKGKAVKFDGLKAEHHLLPSLALEEICGALSFGAEKYEAYNWAAGEGINWSRYFNACLRHLWAFWRGKNKDEESKKDHLAHAGACILILLEMYLISKGKDDRPVYYPKKSEN
ncbi:dATP/dGTP diphosphohydrolase domain-containing protein [Mucilaginibacter sp. OK283]|jgi:hypothetical protein|uniref:dATP/dGTP diphosphohydrolase domain-containing protein n=1 Tax=Mucilaginibacter sp. OK283 TaxID=1881049 RepID=UPI0008BE8DCA|nr:dATP/dGTP diphosphohydrolase domain-containing protein [Mucilaginibacter sp. OK283]SEO14042.1 hypothetical protein SAMN05428947_101455 [Mucilaginibacter sp. OK283]